MDPRAHPLRSALARGVRIACCLAAAGLFGKMAALHASDAYHVSIAGAAIAWGPAPPSLPPGAQSGAPPGSRAAADTEPVARIDGMRPLEAMDPDPRSDPRRR